MKNIFLPEEALDCNFSDILLLNGKWQYVPDKQEKLSYDEIKKIISLGKSLAEMNIPINWQLAGLNNFNGAVWFFKSFKINKNQNEKKLRILQFNGVDYFADAWLNDTYLGNHEGYFQPFYFDVSDLIETSQENLLVVKVISPLEEPKKVWPVKKKLIKGIFNHHDCRPGGWSFEHGQDQNTGGIWNDVSLLLADEVYIESINVSSKINFDENTSLVRISLTYLKKTNSVLNDKIEIEIISPSGKKIKATSEIQLNETRGIKDFVVEVKNPELWWSWDLGKASLYELNFSGNYLNTSNMKFGIREIKLDENNTFYLNKKKLFLRGTNVIPTQFLSELNQKKIIEQVSLIKDANINIIRMHAHVNRNEYYDECDRQGILVWQDFALQWTYDESSEFISNAASQIKDMAKLLYNHPSIAFWCCHNEPGKQIGTLDPFLYDSVLSIDNSRIIRLASNYEEHPYDGWYWGNKEHFAARPMGPLVTEFGAQALPEIESLKKIISEKDFDPPDWDKWAYHNFQYEQTFNIAGVERGNSIEEFVSNSQNYQAGLIQTAIDFYRRGKHKDITGIFQFMFIDCWPSITWSVVDYFTKKKAGYFALQKAFQPLYVSVNVRQRKYFNGKKLNVDFWLINDYQKEFTNCVILFGINKKVISEIPVDNIDEDSIKYFNWEKNEIFLPENLREGKYKIDIELVHKKGKDILSYNDFEIEIVEKE